MNTKQVTHVAQVSRDPIAAVVSSVVLLLGALGLIEKWGIDANELAVALGAVMTVLATVFGLLERRRGSDGQQGQGPSA